MYLARKLACFIVAWLAIELMCFQAYSTSFVPVSLERQLKDSDAVLHGVYKGKIYKRLGSGEIVTEASFKIIKTIGIKPNEMINKFEFKVLYPGGTWQDLNYLVQGAPKFKKDEEVVLLLNRSNFGFWIHNLALGKYSVTSSSGKRRKKILVNSVFPKHARFGKLDYEDFLTSAKTQFHEKFIISRNGIYISRKGKSTLVKGKGRSISSEEKNESSETLESPSSVIIWPVIVFCLLGLFSVLLIRKRK